jgi:hypothetical protein
MILIRTQHSILLAADRRPLRSKPKEALDALPNALLALVGETGPNDH